MYVPLSLVSNFTNSCAKVPSGLKGHDQLAVNISLQLPQKGVDDYPLYVSNFITALPYFSQDFAMANSKVEFGNIALGGYKADVHVDVGRLVSGTINFY